MYQVSIFLLIVLQIHNSCPTFQVAHQWTFVNYTWPNQNQYQTALKKSTYKPENVVIAGIKIYQDNLYLAMPRAREGVPATLGHIPLNSCENNPLITPYPNWEINELNNDCKNHFTSVQSMEIDKNGTMWVLDGFRINNITSRCPPKLVLLDLNNKGKILQSFVFPEELCRSQGGFLNDIVVDDSEGNYAYITDNGNIDPGLIVYSRGENRAWKLRDPSMFAEVPNSHFVVDGRPFSMLAPIDGIALSPKSDGSRMVYYSSVAGLNLYGIDTKILKDEEVFQGSDWRREVVFIGEKLAQSDGLVIDNLGNLYYGLIPRYSVAKWNIKEPWSTTEIVGEDRNKMIWTDSFAFDHNSFLYLLSNEIDTFFNTDYKLEISNRTKLHIMKLETNTNSYLY